MDNELLFFAGNEQYVTYLQGKCSIVFTKCIMMLFCNHMKLL